MGGCVGGSGVGGGGWGGAVLLFHLSAKYRSVIEMHLHTKEIRDVAWGCPSYPIK